MPERSTEIELDLGRRELLNAAVWAAAASAAQAASAFTPIDLKDDRKVRSTGFDLIYEARDADLPEATRAGYVAARSSLPDTKARVQISKKKIDTEMKTLVGKKYWTQAKELLRLQVGNLRFDLNTLAASKSKPEKKVALAANADFFNAVEGLDLAIQQKKPEDAAKAYDKTVSSFDAALKNY